MFFKINFFKKHFQEHKQCQIVWIQIWTDVCRVLILVQTVCKGYPQTTKVVASNEKDNVSFNNFESYGWAYILKVYSLPIVIFFNRNIGLKRAMSMREQSHIRLFF